VLKVANLRFAGHELQVSGYALVRLLVKMAVVPSAEAPGVGPVSDEPDFFGPIEGAENFHPDKAGLLVHQVRTIAKRLFDFGGHVICDNEFAERNERAGVLGGG
jgi:hypothetical protein